MPSW
jgi:hypothetical protein